MLRQNNFSQVCLKRRPSPDEVPCLFHFTTAVVALVSHQLSVFLQPSVVVADCFQIFWRPTRVIVVHFDFGNSYLQLEKIASKLVINVSFLKAPQTEGMAHGSYRSWKSLDNILEIFKALKSMEKSLNSMEIILDKCDADLDNCDYPCIFCLV